MSSGSTGWLAGVGLALALLPSAAHAQGKIPFPEIPKSHWAQEAVVQLAYCGMFTRYPDETFGGARAITRYETAVVFSRFQAEIERLTICQRDPAGPRGAMGPAGRSGPQGPPAAPQVEWTRILSETNSLRQNVSALNDTFAELREQIHTLRGSVSDLTVQTQPLMERSERLHRNRHRVLLERGR